MANKRVTELTALDGDDVADNDLLMIVDVSDPTMAATGTNKRITVAEFATDSTLGGAFVAKSTLTTDGDMLTRAAGVPARITRADLAQDSAFSSRYTSRASTSGRFARAVYTGGDITVTSTTWVALEASLNLTLTGVTAGDVIQCGISAISTDADPIIFLDVVSDVSGSAVSSWSGVGPSNTTWGITAWAMSGNVIGIGGAISRAVVSGDLSAGSLTLIPRVRLNSAGTSTISCGGNVSVVFWAVNLG